MNKLNISCQNFRRIKLNHIRATNLLKDNDILLGQEIQLPSDNKQRENEIKYLSKFWNSKIIISSLLKGAYIVTIIKNRYIDNLINFKEIVEGRAILIKMKNDEYEHNILNIYAPPNNLQEHYLFCQKLFKYVKNENNIIMIGDWNSVFNRRYV